MTEIANTQFDPRARGHLSVTQTVKRMISTPFYSIGITFNIFVIIGEMVNHSKITQWVVNNWHDFTRYLWGLIPFIYIPIEIRDFLTFSAICALTAIAASFASGKQEPLDHPLFEWIGIAVLALIGFVLWGPAFQSMFNDLKSPLDENVPMWIRSWFVCVVVTPMILLLNEQSDEWRKAGREYMPLFKIYLAVGAAGALTAFVLMVDSARLAVESVLLLAFVGFFLCIYVIVSRRQMGLLVPAAALASTAILIDRIVIFASNPPWITQG